MPASFNLGPSYAHLGKASWSTRNAAMDSLPAASRPGSVLHESVAASYIRTSSKMVVCICPPTHTNVSSSWIDGEKYHGYARRLPKVRKLQ